MINSLNLKIKHQVFSCSLSSALSVFNISWFPHSFTPFLPVLWFSKWKAPGSWISSQSNLFQTKQIFGVNKHSLGKTIPWEYKIIIASSLFPSFLILWFCLRKFVRYKFFFCETERKFYPFFSFVLNFFTLNLIYNSRLQISLNITYFHRLQPATCNSVNKTMHFGLLILPIFVWFVWLCLHAFQDLQPIALCWNIANCSECSRD